MKKKPWQPIVFWWQTWRNELRSWRFLFFLFALLLVYIWLSHEYLRISIRTRSLQQQYEETRTRYLIWLSQWSALQRPSLLEQRLRQKGYHPPEHPPFQLPKPNH